MKNIPNFLIILLSVSILSTTSAMSVLPDEEPIIEIDNQIILEEEKRQEVPNFDLQTFDSCESVDTVLRTYLQASYKNLSNNYYPHQRIAFSSVDSIAVESVADVSFDAKISTPVSGTNVQVVGVDESEIIKTNGTHIYYINESSSLLSIASIENEIVTVLRNIALPKIYSGAKLYLEGDTLMLIAQKYQNTYNEQEILQLDRSQKTVAIIFSLTNPEKPKIQQYSMIDGRLSRSRKIGNKLYILTQSSVNFSPWIYAEESDISFDNWIDEYSLSSDLFPSSTTVQIRDEDGYKNKNTTQPDCNSIRYVLPDADTQEYFQTLPEFVTLTVLDIENLNAEPETSVIFGDISEIYMDTTDLYITSRLYSPYGYSCGFARCIMPIFRGDTQTLVHKMNIEDSIEYVASNILPGVPQSQYAMSSLDDDFAMVMQRYAPETATDVYILDENLNKIGSIEGIAPGENFQSSRFIGDKLYLVTFERIDPLFVIDTSDHTNPVIEGELKIPGYSTYLHPYDEDHLIGLGYDTRENKWGGVQNAGVKVDLYDVSDVANPKQLHTQTFGGVGSQSEALNNPRMFVWYPEKNTLFLPAMLMDRNDNYQNIFGWQGLLSMRISPEEGIQSLEDISHISIEDIDTKIAESCDKFKITDDEPVCRQLRSGQEICSYPQQNTYNSIPEYCYSDIDATSAYMGSQLWNHSASFIKRAIYIGDTLIVISDEHITTHGIENNLGEISNASWE